MNPYLFEAGYMIQGGLVLFTLFSAYFFGVAMPYFRQKYMSRAMKSLYSSVVVMFLVSALDNLVWIVAEMLPNQTGSYESVEDNLPIWIHSLLVYIDLLTMPVAMQVGFSLTTGKFKIKRYVVMLIPFVLFYIAEMITGWHQVMDQILGVLTIILCFIQLLWSWNYIRRYEKLLRANYSNVEHRSMKWFLYMIIPMFVLSIIYAPLCLFLESDIYSIIFDLLTLIVFMFIFFCVFNYHVDKNTEVLVKQQINEIIKQGVGTSNADASTNEETVTEQVPTEGQIVADESLANSEPVSEPEPIVEQATQVEPIATSEPIAESESLAKPIPINEHEPEPEPVVEAKEHPFTSRMKALEAEKFYLDPDVNIDWLCNKLGTNRHYVSDYLNNELHVSFYDYINNLRLLHAERLLLRGEKVNQVAYSSGFNSDHTFRRLFKERYSVTPTQYLKQVA